MNPRTLLTLYPRAFRERYGEELIAMMGDRPVGVQQTVDLIVGAADAWVSPQMRAAGAAQSSGGSAVVQTLKASCASRSVRFTTRDGLIGAGAMLATTFVLLALGIAANRSGWHTAGDVLKGGAFPVSLMASVPFTYLKGHAWRAQALLIVPVVLVLLGISYVATLI